MPIFSKATSIGVSAAIFATAIMTSVASAATVAPNKVNFGLNNMSPGTCPAKVRLIGKVYSKSAGNVQIRFERGDGSTSGPIWVPVVAMPSGLYVGKIEHIYAAIPGPLKFKVRIVASGGGKTKKSKWDTLKIKC